MKNTRKENSLRIRFRLLRTKFPIWHHFIGKIFPGILNVQHLLGNFIWYVRSVSTLRGAHVVLLQHVFVFRSTPIWELQIRPSPHSSPCHKKESIKNQSSISEVKETCHLSTIQTRITYLQLIMLCWWGSLGKLKRLGIIVW